MRCRPSDSRCYRQGGAALVAALLVFALASALIVAMAANFSRIYQQSSGVFLAQQSEAYLRGAEALASLALQLDYDQDQAEDSSRDDLQEIWAQEEAPYPLEEGGWLSGTLEDLQGRFNLNRLAESVRREEDSGEGGPRFTAAQGQFIRLLQVLGEPEISEQEAIAITEAVGDWLDEDDIPRLDGAEGDYYLGQTPAYRCANRPMASPSELLAVRGVSVELYHSLEPLVTVWPLQPAPMNIHTAPLAVLRSIAEDESLVPLSQSEGEALLADREENGFADKEAFLQHPVFADRRDKMTETAALLGENSDHFLLRAEVKVAERNSRLYSVLQRQGRNISALVRTSGSL